MRMSGNPLFRTGAMTPFGKQTLEALLPELARRWVLGFNHAVGARGLWLVFSWGNGKEWRAFVFRFERLVPQPAHRAWGNFHCPLGISARGR